MGNSDRVNAAAASASERAAQFFTKASEVADEVLHRAGPVAAQASARAAELAAKAGKAAAPHVDTVASSLKNATSGKGAGRIDSLGSALKKILDPDLHQR